MKNILKVFLLVISLVVVLSVSVVPAFAAEATSSDDAAVSETQEDENYVKYRVDEEGNLILIVDEEDGEKEYKVSIDENESEDEAKGINIKFNPGNMVGSLRYMWQGMLCIFVVIGVIILSVYLMSTLSAKMAERKQSDNDEENK